ncbi:hypothetical protein QYE76_006071 [Lolium multiflorum]|uniref:25S rRNA (uridine-N(3))-methyltransferase BMT5-like domain-containing protein n=1 Tax=Lolium multiflorum TaxID=4521 RepID=A0AAD8W420_LOLMU|nr:hypothetical protein QYE76_006071 [Lolium multiflorum]
MQALAVAAGTKWLKHYSSDQSILTVGDGDFSFSLALATAFGSGKNIVATSLDTYVCTEQFTPRAFLARKSASTEELNTKYSHAVSNVKELERLGATVLHGVDVKEMNVHADLWPRLFDRIVFNFPHAGFNGREDNADMIKSHQELVRGFFSTARHMLFRQGEVHVTHKTKHPYWTWGIEQLASESSLTMLEEAAFQIQDYPGYNQKRGSGWRCDRDFDISDSRTFIFLKG